MPVTERRRLAHDMRRRSLLLAACELAEREGIATVTAARVANAARPRCHVRTVVRVVGSDQKLRLELVRHARACGWRNVIAEAEKLGL